MQRESWWDGSEDSGDLLSPARSMALESWDVTPEAASPEQARRGLISSYLTPLSVVMVYSEPYLLPVRYVVRAGQRRVL